MKENGGDDAKNQIKTMNGNTQSHDSEEQSEQETAEEYEVTAYVDAEEIQVGEKVRVRTRSKTITGEVTGEVNPDNVDVDVGGETLEGYTVDTGYHGDLTLTLAEKEDEFFKEQKTVIHIEMPDKDFYDGYERAKMAHVKRTADVSVPTDCVDYGLDADVTAVDGIGEKTDQELYADTVGELISRLCVDYDESGFVGADLSRRVDDDIRFAGTRTDEYGVEIDYRVPDDVDLDDEEQEVEQVGGVTPEVQTGERTVEEEQDEELEVGDTIKIDGEEYDVTKQHHPDEFDFFDEIDAAEVSKTYTVVGDTYGILLVVLNDGTVARDLYLYSSEGIEEYASRGRADDIKQEFSKVADIRIGTEPGRNLVDNWPQIQIYERGESDDWYFVEFESGDYHKYETVEKDNMAYVVDQFLADPITEHINRPRYEGYAFEEFVRVKRDRIGAADRLLDD